MEEKGSKTLRRKPPRIASYGSALDFRQDEAALIGQIIAKWNVVEYDCVNILADALGCGKGVAEQLVYAVPSSSARMNVILAAADAQLASFEADARIAATLKALFNDIHKCLQMRNLLAHGVYAQEKGELRNVKVREGFFDDSQERKISLEKLKACQEKMNGLLPRISAVCTDVRDARLEFGRNRRPPA